MYTFDDIICYFNGLLFSSGKQLLNPVIAMRKHITVNPLYNNIRYNSIICYNLNLVLKKSADRVFFHCYSHVILQENVRFVYLLESPR